MRAILPIMARGNPIHRDSHKEVTLALRTGLARKIVRNADLSAAAGLGVIRRRELVPTIAATNKPCSGKRLPARTSVDPAVDITIMALGVRLIAIVRHAVVVVGGEEICESVTVFEFQSRFRSQREPPLSTVRQHQSKEDIRVWDGTNHR